MLYIFLNLPLQPFGIRHESELLENADMSPQGLLYEKDFPKVALMKPPER
ncbi:MAG: hypothetical protein AABZ40_02465 [Thermodesulfobacteriota bacterium]